MTLRYNIEDLKLSLKEQIAILEVLEKARPQLKADMRAYESNLRMAKKGFNRITKDIKEKKIRIKRIKNYISSYPRKLKGWSQNNIGKLLNKIEGKHE